MVELTDDTQVTRTRRAALSQAGLRQLATTTATIAVADEDIDIAPAALPPIVDAILQLAEGWLTLQGVLLAADRLDNLIADTQRHLIDPAADRAESNPHYREILRMHQQYIDGMRAAQTEIGSAAEHTLNRAKQTSEEAARTPPPSPPGDMKEPIRVDHTEAR